MLDTSAPEAPEVSVVLSTYNRGALLVDAMRSVLAQKDAPPYEFIVVDNNSKDDTRTVVEQMIAESGGRLRYVFEGQQGLSHGRNAGVRASRAPLIAFTDDDVRASANWVATIHRAFNDHPWATFVGGRVLPRWPATPPAWLTAEHWAPLAVTDYGPEPFRVDERRPVCLVGANLAARRSAFDQVGLFDPNYQHVRGAVSAIEDHEWQMRVIRAGGAGLYMPDIVLSADVQLNRLDKAYHRKWHFDHGHAMARLLGPGETFDTSMRPVPVSSRFPALFGVAPWAYRQLMASALRFAGAWVRGQSEEAFRHECDAREVAGHIAQRANARRETPVFRPTTVQGATVQ